MRIRGFSDQFDNLDLPCVSWLLIGAAIVGRWPPHEARGRGAGGRRSGDRGIDLERVRDHAGHRHAAISERTGSGRLCGDWRQ